MVVEDDAPLASFIRKGLEAEHYAVDVAPDSELARLIAVESEYDLLILDLNLSNGISVLNSVRPKKTFPSSTGADGEQPGRGPDTVAR